MNIKLQYLFWLAITSFLGACTATSPTNSIPAHSRDEAAAVLISVNTVAPWAQVADVVQPNFALTGDTALQQIAPITLRIQEQVMSAFGASLGIGLPQSSSQSVATNTQSSSQTATTTASNTITTGTSTVGSNSSSTSTKQPGTAPQVPSGTPASAPALTAPSVTGDIGLDPILKYQAALALYQSVQLMNRGVQNAASMGCFAPYLVQLKLAILPYRGDLPYDLHARVSFFRGGEGSSGAPVNLYDLKSGPAPAGSPAQGNCQNSSQLPQIVPLLVTDDIERAIKSRAVETARQFGLALSGMYQGVGANLGLNSLNQSLTALSGQDINSRLTVARLSDNTLYVRIGAANEATAGKALIGQTYDVSLLLLVPLGYFDSTGSEPQIQVVSHTEFRDPTKGSILPNRPGGAIVSAADQAMQDVLSGDLLAAWNAAKESTKQKVALELACPIQTAKYWPREGLTSCGNDNDLPYHNFEEIIDHETIPSSDGKSPPVSFKTLSEDYRKILWTRLSVLLADSPFKTAFFALHRPPKVYIPSQTALLFDDTKDTTQIQLHNVTGASNGTVTASLLLIDVPAKEKQLQTYQLAAHAISLDPNTQVLTLTFPSLGKWGIANFDLAKSYLEVKPQPCLINSVCPEFEVGGPFNLRYLAVESAQAGATAPHFDFKANASTVVTSAGKAPVTVTISNLKDDDAVITVDGVEIISAADASGTALQVSNGQVKVSKDTTVTLQMQGVRSGMTIVLTAEGHKDKASTGKKTISFLAFAG